MSASRIGSASRGVLAEIDERLKGVERELARYQELLGERDRLLAARATLLGESTSRRVSQDEIAAYLDEHPGSQPRQIADALGVTPNRISAHLFRAKGTRFASGADGWRVRKR